ncbi:BURP domain protein RD22-like isoform X2 [Manihot esculenta]|uniref:BURP domain-containing protein n=1 Tax=Manihot esculenta TaxID=3983 RepID=A0A2C9W6Y5_MANES|nr:BURP domain protein RD22-like isoform X2 [Manihot esculenta]OAY55107.1 hypothetical protein MANES_03G128100v8 [Manihot esculenta]
MEFHLFPLFALLLVLEGINSSLLPAEVYWRSKLPNTPLPKALQDLLKPADERKKITYSFSEDAVGARICYEISYWEKMTKISNQNSIPSNTTTIFFLQDDLLPGKKMKLAFTKSTNGSNFLPREIAESIPFSTNKLSEILNHFSINPRSKEAEIMKITIEECEAPNLRGQDKYCATSLESLVDFAIGKYGKNVEAVLNEAEEENESQEYTILKGIIMVGEEQIVCHRERYVYAVFYCHTIKFTKVYSISMVGEDGSKAKAIVVCHTDTSAWSPKHYAFQVLKVKPGGPPICHFLNDDAIVWVPY